MLCIHGIHANPTFAQNTAIHTASGLEIQAYPAGFTGTGRLTYPIGTKLTWTFHVGVNITDRRDWGEHDDESGSGVGFGGVVRYFFNEEGSGFHAGVRNDLWFMDIEWMQNTGQMGFSDVIVWQPTAQFGYTIVPANSQLLFDFTLSFGQEINIDTTGDPVGQGPILLGGIGFSYRFR